jgi:hypothetical protein
MDDLSNAGAQLSRSIVKGDGSDGSIQLGSQQEGSRFLLTFLSFSFLMASQ